uniref:Uncharacterized protein n=1 Tax=Timema tahoe TaxID=61484 RepID=A0A7R9FHC9_9NEOP|nr:unnamed protein product [Timema tahoe]
MSVPSRAQRKKEKRKVTCASSLCSIGRAQPTSKTVLFRARLETWSTIQYVLDQGFPTCKGSRATVETLGIKTKFKTVWNINKKRFAILELHAFSREGSRVYNKL